jgi:hypothetical protein
LHSNTSDCRPFAGFPESERDYLGRSASILPSNRSNSMGLVS